MKKIPTLFVRDMETKKVINKVTEGLEWVNDKNVMVKATRKYDGTCCMIMNNLLWKRYDAKKGKIPNSFIPSQEPDQITGHYPGWVWCDYNDPSNKYHYEGLRHYIKTYSNNNPFINLQSGTYELIGEKINGNPEKIEGHQLIEHGVDILYKVPTDYEGLKKYLYEHPYMEGIVFYDTYINTLNEYMCKIKRRDFDYGE